MQIAELVATRSTCLRRKVGAVLVKDKRILATGYNGAPRNLPHCEVTGCLREKLRIPSGERQEICSTLYCTHQPCITCSKMIINAGIEKVVFKGEYPDRLAREMLEEAKVKLIKFGGENG